WSSDVCPADLGPIPLPRLPDPDCSAAPKFQDPALPFPAGGPAPLNRLCSSHRQVCGSVKSRGVLLSYWVRLHECAYHKKRKQQISTKERSEERRVGKEC